MGRGIVPDRIIVSTSARTRETWELASPGGGEVGYDDRVYEASSADLREVIGETPHRVLVLVLVGHNPGIERLVWELDDSPHARDLTNQGLPTSAIAVLTVDDWTLASAALQDLAAPRG